MTPSDAGFDGTFRAYPNGVSKVVTVRLRRCMADSDQRFSGLRPQELACWINDDGTVKTFVYKSVDGVVYELPFVPIER